MIGKIIPEAYDYEGTLTNRPVRRANTIFHPTYPLGRFWSQPLTVKCHNLADIRTFLETCRYRSDPEQFGRDDYWLPPEQFEQTRAGDCEDFALWTWRQLTDLGYSCRLVVGESGRYGAGHAWLTAEKDGVRFLVEPQRHWVGERLPSLSTIRYQPQVSVEWDGSRFTYFQHAHRDFNPRFLTLPGLVAEWITIWLPLFPRVTWSVVRHLFRCLRRRIHSPRRLAA